jgi:hypothetical protein
MFQDDPQHGENEGEGEVGGKTLVYSLFPNSVNSPTTHEVFSDEDYNGHIYVAFEMCHYDYYQYDLCGHKAIEILQYCNEVLWKAGMTFQLRPCPEENFVNFCEKILNIPSKDIGKCYWKGMSGYCKMCESSFQVCLAMFLLRLS